MVEYPMQQVLAESPKDLLESGCSINRMHCYGTPCLESILQ